LGLPAEVHDGAHQVVRADLDRRQAMAVARHDVEPGLKMSRAARSPLYASPSIRKVRARVRGDVPPRSATARSFSEAPRGGLIAALSAGPAALAERHASMLVA
jgi:hypothetical protein